MVTKSIGHKPGVESIAPKPATTGRASDVGGENRVSGKSSNYGVALSDDGKSKAGAYKKAYDVAKSAPEIREDLVAKYKAQIAAGTYTPDAGNIADGMLREAAREELAKRS
jgi:flagellar biosynthesis anti-sigma factor FlgM